MCYSADSLSLLTFGVISFFGGVKLKGGCGKASTGLCNGFLAFFLMKKGRTQTTNWGLIFY